MSCRSKFELSLGWVLAEHDQKLMQETVNGGDKQAIQVLVCCDASWVYGERWS
jgi:hypothetical protein